MAKLISSSTDATVTINPGYVPRQKGCPRPRKGTFEIRVNGDAVLSLVGLKRPFSKLKALDIEEEADSVIQKIKAT